MKQNKISQFLIFLSVFFIAACKSNDIMTDPVFAKYQNRFIEEGRKRGVSDEILNRKVKIQFGITTNQTAGMCEYKPGGINTITIYPDAWNLETYDEALDLYRENFLFHELGHCILFRDHKPDLLEDREVASMMRAGTASETYFNYKGKRRTYYLDELFNEQTPAPYWSKVSSFVDFINPSNRTLKVSEEFDKPTPMLPDSNIYSFNGGNLIISTKSLKMGQEVISPKMLEEIAKVTTDDSFEIETKIKFSENGEGFIFYPNGYIFPPPHEYPRDLFIFSNYRQSISVVNIFSFVVIKKVNLSDGQFHLMKLRKWKDDVYCFADDNLIGIWDITPLTVSAPPLQKYGKSLSWFLALSVPENSVCEVDYLRFYQLK